MNIILNFRNKYRSIPTPVKASFWFMAMSIIQKGIQFIVTPIYTRVLTTDEYGYYSVFNSWTGIITIFATLTLNGGCFNNGMLKYSSDQRKYVSCMQGLSNAATMVVFSIIFMFRKWFSEWSGMTYPLLIGMFLLLIFNPAFLYWTSYQRYNYSYRTLIAATLISAIMTPIIGITLAITLGEHRRYAVILAHIIVNTAVGIIFYIINLIRGKSLYNKEYWIYALKFNLPLIPHYLSSVVLGQSDRIMINNYCSQSETGIYSLAYSISMMLGIVTTALNSSYVPWVYKKMNNQKYDDIRKISNYILLFFGSFLLIGCMIAPEMIRILGSEEYSQAKWIVPPVMVGSYFIMLYSLFANIEFYFEKNISIMIASVLAATLNIILNAVFIPRFGYMAAGYTTMICYIVLTIIHYIFMRKSCKEKSIKIPYSNKFIIVFSFILSVITLMIMFIYNFSYLRYIFVLIIVVAAIALRKKIKKIFNIIKQ